MHIKAPYKICENLHFSKTCRNDRGKLTRKSEYKDLGIIGAGLVQTLSNGHV